MKYWIWFLLNIQLNNFTFSLIYDRYNILKRLIKIHHLFNFNLYYVGYLKKTFQTVNRIKLIVKISHWFEINTFGHIHNKTIILFVDQFIIDEIFVSTLLYGFKSGEINFWNFKTSSFLQNYKNCAECSTGFLSKGTFILIFYHTLLPIRT